MTPLLTRKLALESPSSAPDGAGGLTVTWTELGTLWAEIVPRAGREVVSGDRETSVQRHRITVRGAPVGSERRPQADQRFREGVRVFDILSVSEADPVGRYLVCDVEERPGT